MEIVTTYDRSSLIERAVDTLQGKLVEEFIVVALVCALFLFPPALIAVIVVLSLPVGILVAFIIMNWQGINANIMSLGGIAIAIGAMVDAAIVMIENVHKRIEKRTAHRRESLADCCRRRDRCRPTAVLFTSHYYVEFPAGVHARGTGRAPVRAAGVHQDLCNGRGGRIVDHACAGVNGVLYSWQRHSRKQESDQIVL